MSWQDEENARRAARLDREREWQDEHRALPALAESDWAPGGWTARPAPRCNCGCQGDSAPHLAGLEDVPPESGQPAAVLLAWQLGRRSDPAAVREEARAAQAARLAEPGLDGRDALRRLSVSRNPDGGNLSGRRALAIMRQLSIGGIGHEPGGGHELARAAGPAAAQARSPAP